MTTRRLLVSNGKGPRTLFTLAVAYRKGDQKAGWEFATSPQIEAVITSQVGVYCRYSHVREEDLQDLRSDLRMRVLERLASPTFRLPTYHVPRLNEAALVAYFRRAIMDLAQRAMRQIVGERTVRKRGAVVVSAADIGGPETDFGLDQIPDLGMSDPVELMDKDRRLRVLAFAQKFFSNDDEARIGFAALYHRANGLEQWDEIAEAVGLGKSHGRITRGLAMRWRNLLKAALIENGEDVGFCVMGIYTSLSEAGVCLLSSSGSMQTWTLPALTVMSPEALANRILKVLTDEDVVTFAALNMDDHSSPMRMAALRALHYRAPLVEKFDISWLEAHVADRLKGFRRYGDAKRRAVLVAQAKLAECQLKREARRPTRGVA